MRRVVTPVSLEVANERLQEYKRIKGSGPHPAASLADVIWPDAEFITAQGAGAAASRVLKRLKYKWGADHHNWGWYL